MKNNHIFYTEVKIATKNCSEDYYNPFLAKGKSYASDFNMIDSFCARARFAAKIINGIKKTAYTTVILLALNMIISEYAQAFTSTVTSAATVTGEIVSGGNQEVFGTTNNTTVLSGGSQTVLFGGIANNTTINNEGKQEIRDRGTANNTKINSNGTQLVDYDGTANNTTVNGGGLQFVSINGKADRTTVGAGGVQTVFGGSAFGTILYQGGSQIVASGGSADNIVNNGGLVNALSGSAISNYSGKDGKINIHGDNTLSGNTNLIGGTLNIINSGGFHTINIENLQSDNAVINMNADMQTHTGDLLKISGRYNGPSLIGLTNTASKITQITGDGLKLVEIDAAATGSGTFALAGGKWDAGGYEYMLYQGTQNAVGNDWYLRSANSFSDVFKTMVNVPLLNNVLAETGMNSLQRRLGDLRNMGSRDNGIWARTYYKDITIDELQKTDMKIFGVEAGYDRLITSEESNKIYVGVMLGYIKTEKIKGKQSNGYYGNGEGESPSAGIYGTLINDEGWFIDLAARNFWTKLDMINYSSGGTELSFKPKRNIAALSAEAGKEIKTELGKSSYIRIEPKIEAKYMNASSGSAEVLNGVDDLSWDRTDYLSAKAAVLIGYAKKRKSGLLIEPLLELSYKYEFLGKGTVKYGGASYDVDLSGGVIEGNIGINMQLTENLYWYALAGYEKGGKITGLGANAGIRYSFGKKYIKDYINEKEAREDIKEYQDNIKGHL
ncbi:MAG: autotransporter outer membrane beta-barrel domain-containing protein [Elusimicrobiota bacterium]|jgi:outer membrane autotransporter protein|nr:autotransporter outer membrane beta-barrel domain-containing protein [Elusimicrobiota bacterium]